MTTRMPLSEGEKQYIGLRHKQGVSLKQIAVELNCSYETVGKWWRYVRQEQRPARRGRPSHGVLSTYPQWLRESAVAIKRAHPHWGPANVRLELQHQSQAQPVKLPSLSRLAALFKAVCPEAVQPRLRQQYPEQVPPHVVRPHQRWQLDAKEAIPLGEGELATVLEVRDPVAALMIASRAFVTTTAKGWRKLTLRENQATLRQAFWEWGLPLEVQTDHENVYVGPAEGNFPSLFTLWLIGLGIEHRLSRRHRPTDQPQVERNHRTTGDMGWKDEHPTTVEQLQAVLDRTRQRYNEEFPSRAAHCQGQPPLRFDPAAKHSGRPFDPATEWHLFALERVDAFLATQLWSRQVNDTGVVSLAGDHYYVGRVHARHTVTVQFIPGLRLFRFTLQDATLIAQLPAKGLEQADIIGYVPAEIALPLPAHRLLALVSV